MISFVFTEADSLLNLELTYLAILAIHIAMGVPSLPPECGIVCRLPHTSIQHLWGCWGSELWSLRSHDKCFAHQTISLVPRAQRLRSSLSSHTFLSTSAMGNRVRRFSTKVISVRKKLVIAHYITGSSLKARTGRVQSLPMNHGYFCILREEPGKIWGLISHFIILWWVPIAMFQPVLQNWLTEPHFYQTLQLSHTRVVDDRYKP